MKIVLIGAGNVGYHLGMRLHEVGEHVVQVFSRTPNRAEKLANKIGAKACSKLSKIKASADLYIVAVKDDAILAVVKELASNGLQNKLIVHTSGGTGIGEMGNYVAHFGSFYPLQTFSITKKANWAAIPICVDANSKKSRKKLKKLAQKISPKTYEIDDEQRAILHVAAVFVNNFSNHLFHIGATICEKEQLPFSILKPLIEETVNKLKIGEPKAMQTGPAIRNDQKTIAKHHEYLEKFPDFKKIYEELTTSIQNNNA